MKAFLPLATVKKNMPWANDFPAPFVRFIGVAEIPGAIGLILPAAPGIASWLMMQRVTKRYNRDNCDNCDNRDKPDWKDTRSR